jgi:hypothetical protein
MCWFHAELIGSAAGSIHALNHYRFFTQQILPSQEDAAGLG